MTTLIIVLFLLKKFGGPKVQAFAAKLEANLAEMRCKGSKRMAMIGQKVGAQMAQMQSMAAACAAIVASSLLLF